MGLSKNVLSSNAGMKKSSFSDPKCRHCRFYEPEGRRGGCCQKLGVTVNGSWSACSLVCFPFSDILDEVDFTLDTVSKTLATLEEIVHLETALSIPYETEESDLASQQRLMLPSDRNSSKQEIKEI